MTFTIAKKWNYYNDNDPAVAAWAEELIKEGLVPDGEIDTRSILEVEPADLVGYTQCHFFCGILGWSYALRLAGWPDDRPVWTGSPPCQPFSVAGQGLARDDPRHLAPHFISLVRACRPPVLFGEQVASAEVFGKVTKRAAKAPAREPAWSWLDDLSDRLEAAHYAVGASDIPAAGVGAPHIRQRCFFGAVDLRNASSGLADTRRGGHEPERYEMAGTTGKNKGGKKEWERVRADAGYGQHLGGVADTDNSRPQGRDGVPERADQLPAGTRGVVGIQPPAGPTNGFWGSADRLRCRDDKWRPVEPGAFPLAHGVPDRVGILRGYGNAIVPEVAATFIESFRDVIE